MDELPDKETAEERRAASLSAHLTTLVSSGVEAREATVGPGWRGDNVHLARWAATRAARWRRPAISARQSSKASRSKERSSSGSRMRKVAVGSDCMTGPGSGSGKTPRRSAVAASKAAASERCASIVVRIASCASNGGISAGGSSIGVPRVGTRFCIWESERSESAAETSMISSYCRGPDMHSAV